MPLNQELVTNGTFTAWTDDDPDGWDVVGEVGTDPEVSEVGTGEGHGGVGTGMCNIYTSVGALVSIERNVGNLIIGRKYRVSILIDTVIAGNCYVGSSPIVFTNQTFGVGDEGTYTWTFVATSNSIKLRVARSGICDVTFDDVSIRFIAETDLSTDLSRTGQHFSSFPEN